MHAWLVYCEKKSISIYTSRYVTEEGIMHASMVRFFNLFIPAVLTENIWKVWDSHRTQLYCSQTGLRFFIELLVRQHVSAPSFRPSSGLQDVHTGSSQLLFL